MNSFASITKIKNGKTRLITAENVYGEKGKGGMADITGVTQPEVEKIGQLPSIAQTAASQLGQKWKVRPCIDLEAESVTTIMDVDGPANINHIWITVDNPYYRDLILRFYWDNEETPSVEVPVGDFFGCPFLTRLKITAIPINVNPSGGMNCFFPMPFRKHAKVTVENRSPKKINGFFYAISYELGEVADDEAYFHAQFRRSNPLKYKDDYVIVDGIKGKGHYVGTQMGWQQNNQGWWGEGEIKAFIDGDSEFPTYCGTGTEDYFGGAWGFCENFSAPFFGYQDLMMAEPDGMAVQISRSSQYSMYQNMTPVTTNRRATNAVGNRHSLYRYHIMDPIRFDSDLKVTMQAIGWRSEGRYLPLQDDICSVAYWYQAEPHNPFPQLGSRDDLEVI